MTSRPAACGEANDSGENCYHCDKRVRMLKGMQLMCTVANANTSCHPSEMLDFDSGRADLFAFPLAYVDEFGDDLLLKKCFVNLVLICFGNLESRGKSGIIL